MNVTVTTGINVAISDVNAKCTVVLRFMKKRDYDVFRVICNMFGTAPNYDKESRYKIILVTALRTAVAQTVEIDYGIDSNGNPLSLLGLQEAKAIIEGNLSFDELED